MIRCELGVILAVRKARRAPPYTQKDLSRISGVNEVTLSRWVNNAVSRYDADVLDALCTALKVTPGDLLVQVPEEEG
jgi:DNA-binding Xre family transcriptional regulator